MMMDVRLIVQFFVVMLVMDFLPFVLLVVEMELYLDLKFAMMEEITRLGALVAHQLEEDGIAAQQNHLSVVLIVEME